MFICFSKIKKFLYKTEFPVKRNSEILVHLSMKITRPTLLIDSQKCKNNIKRMAEKAWKNNVEFRPHFKTHQSHEIGSWFRECGVDKLTVSSVQMAQYFAEDGWGNITIAFPLNMLEIAEINELAKAITLNVLVESKKVLQFAEDSLQSKVGVFVKIDTGYHRTGIPIDNLDEIDKLIKCFSGKNKCQFKGFLAHNGHTYKASSIKEIERIHFNTLDKLKALKAKYIQAFPNLTLSLGDTPSMSVLNDFRDIDEIRPGNFVFYDLMQSNLDVCLEEDIAVAMACPVVAKHKDRNQIVIYGGGVHFSKESLKINDQIFFGKLVLLENNMWTILPRSYYLTSLSQEHGIIQLDKMMINKITVGGLVGILPVHSCLTADKHKFYLTEASQTTKKFHP